MQNKSDRHLFFISVLVKINSELQFPILLIKQEPSLYNIIYLRGYLVS